MRVKYKLFPYPIVCAELDDYKQNKFEVNFEIFKEINNIRFKFDTLLDDPLLKKMLKEEQVELIYHVECAKTLYRQIHGTQQLIDDVVIDEKYLNGNVDICCFIVAKKDIDAYSNNNFNEDYIGVSFEILKGNILGFYNLPRVNFTKNPEELAQISSIVSILRKEDIQDGMIIEIDSDKIKICLGNEEFIKYKNFAKSSIYQPMLHAMLIFPALMYALDMIMKEGEEEYQDYRWFKAIEKILSSSQLKLTKEVIEQMTSYKLAQKLLKLPINRALNNMKHGEDDVE